MGVNRLAEYLTAAKNLTLPSLVGKVTPCTSFLPRSPLHPDVFYATTKPLKRSILLSPSPFLPLLAPLSPVSLLPLPTRGSSPCHLGEPLWVANRADGGAEEPSIIATFRADSATTGQLELLEFGTRY